MPELGLRGDHQRGHWLLSVFDTRISHMIAYDAATMAPANIDRAHIRGVEASADVHVADWIGRASATWLDPRDAASGSNDGNLLPRRARATARIDLDRSVRPCQFRWQRTSPPDNAMTTSPTATVWAAMPDRPAARLSPRRGLEPALVARQRLRSTLRDSALLQPARPQLLLTLRYRARADRATRRRIAMKPPVTRIV